MTTLTIQIADNEVEAITTISNIIKNIGGSIDIENDDLTPKEFDMLQESYKEALMIKDGIKKGFLFLNCGMKKSDAIKKLKEILTEHTNSAI